jgi:hypothetical protein
LAGQRWLLAGIALVSSVILVFILLRYTEGFWGTLGLSAVLGGAVGNLIDRVVLGYVVDMFRPLFIDFAVFNIADIFITLGFTTFCLHFIVMSIKSSRSDKKDFKTIPSQEGDQDELYSYPEELGEPDFDDFSDTRAIPPVNSGRSYDPTERSVSDPATDSYAETAQDQEYKEISSWQEYYEPVPDPPAEVISSLQAISALDALESELGLGDDMNVDDMLREYGFEDD